jgi:hypothetical protein
MSNSKAKNVKIKDIQYVSKDHPFQKEIKVKNAKITEIQCGTKDSPLKISLFQDDSLSFPSPFFYITKMISKIDTPKTIAFYKNEIDRLIEGLIKMKPHIKKYEGSRKKGARKNAKKE